MSEKIKSYISNERTLRDESNDIYYNIIMVKLTKMYMFERPFVEPAPKYGNHLVA